MLVSLCPHDPRLPSSGLWDYFECGSEFVWNVQYSAGAKGGSHSLGIEGVEEVLKSEAKKKQSGNVARLSPDKMRMAEPCLAEMVVFCRGVARRGRSCGAVMRVVKKRRERASGKSGGLHRKEWYGWVSLRFPEGIWC